MKHGLLIAMACTALAGTAEAEGLLGKVRTGVSNTVEKTGEVLNKGAQAVGETVDSTAEMASNEETPELTRQRMDLMAQETLARLSSDYPESVDLYDRSYGYAVFDSRQATLVGATAGYGRGVAVAQESGAKTYMKMATGGVGLSFGIGGFDRKVVILFEDQAGFDAFVTNGFDATADVGAMAGEDKDGEELRFVDGRSYYVLTKKGWKVSATATGTKYWRDADLN